MDRPIDFMTTIKKLKPMIVCIRSCLAFKQYVFVSYANLVLTLFASYLSGIGGLKSTSVKLLTRYHIWKQRKRYISGFNDSDYIDRDYFDVVGVNFNSICFYRSTIVLFKTKFSLCILRNSRVLVEERKKVVGHIIIERFDKTFAVRNCKIVRKYKQVDEIVYRFLRTFHCLW